MSRRAWLLIGWALSAVAASAQTTLYVTISPYVYAFNAQTGALAGNAPWLSTTSFNWQAATDSSGRLYVALYGQGNVGVYDLAAGTTLSSAFIGAGVNTPTGLGVWGGNLYVASQPLQRISLYNAASGVLVNANFISGFASPEYLLTDGQGRLYVSDYAGTVGVFDAATGAAINRNLITGITGVPMGMAIDVARNRLFVASVQGDSVGVYDATTGALLNANLIAGLDGPRALALDPSGALYVSSYNSAGGYYQVGKFDSLTGATINATLLINGGAITSLNVVAVPEPAVAGLLALGLLLIGGRGVRRWAERLR